MSTQETNEIHAICRREQCGYDGIVIPKARKGASSLLIVAGICVPFLFVTPIAGILALLVGISPDNVIYVGLVLGLLLVIVGVAGMFIKELSCPACSEGTMFDVYEDRGAVLYARKYPSAPPG